MTSTTSTKKTIITLRGNVGGDPQRIEFAERVKDIGVYDPVIDDVVTKSITIEASYGHRFSLAVNDRENPGTEPRWISVFDPDNHSERLMVRKGDWLELRGYFEERIGTDKATGERKFYRNFHLLELEVKNRKVRRPAA